MASFGQSGRDRANSDSTLASQSQPSTSRGAGLKPTAKLNCNHCKKVIKNSGSSIECEICLYWSHLSCTDLTENDIQTITKAGVHWYCKTCDNRNTGLEARVIGIENDIASIKELCTNALQKQSNSVTESYASIVHKLKENTDNINGSILKSCETIVQKQQQSDKKKAEDLDRAKNVIIFGTEEVSFDDTQALLSRLLRDCDIYTKIDITCSTCHHIGKPEESKKRPLRLKLSSENEKWEVLKSINKARVPGIFARLDLNSDQRKQDFLLRQELRQTRAKNPELKYKIQKSKIIQISQ